MAGNIFRRIRSDKFGDVITADMLTELDATGWELYHVDEDFAETTNLADQERARLIAMIGMWYTEAGRYNVLPIDSRATARIAEERPQIAQSRDRYVLYPGTQSIPAAAAPKILNRPYSINAEVDAPDGAEGVLLSMGGNDGGITLLRSGRAAVLRAQLRRQGDLLRQVGDSGARGPPLPQHGVRTDR